MLKFELPSKSHPKLQRLLYRRDKYLGGGGRGEIIFLLRCILESHGNGNDALIEPIVGAVAGCLKPEFTSRGLQLIEAFDQIPLMAILQTMRGLDLFSEESIGRYYAVAVRNKLAAILEPALPKPAPVQAKRKKRNASSPKRRPADQPAPRMAA